MIHTPNKKAIKYKGEGEYIFREEQSRERPVLRNGDIVICSIYTAALLTRRKQHDFEYVDLNEVIATPIAAAVSKGKGIVDAVKDLASKL